MEASPEAAMATHKRTKRSTVKKARRSAADQPSDSQRDILTRLNGLIFLVADTFPRPPEPESTSKQKNKKKSKPPGRSEDLAVRLAQAGLRPIEIAGLTGRHQNNVNRDLSKARKQGRLPRAK